MAMSNIIVYPFIVHSQQYSGAQNQTIQYHNALQ